MSFITNTENPELFSTLKKSTQAKLGKIAQVLQEQILTRQDAEAQEQESKNTLRPLARQAYFEANENVSAADQTAAVHTFDFGGLQVNFVNSYVIKDKAHADQILDLIGDSHPLAEHLHITSRAVTDVTALSNDNPKLYKAYADALTALNKKFGLKTYVEDKFAVSQEFHDIRHELLTSADNLELDKLLPVQVQLSVTDN